ncbi:MAG: TetR/AcrR family transcriptional regulator [Actinomycetota bacterium]|jgi:AcrR family transcriptional regulator
MTDQPRRGRRLSEERTEHILGTVLEVLHDVGYDQLRMQDVADRACVGLSTIYRRWPTKQDLVRASLSCERAEQKYVATGDPRSDVKTFLTRLAEDLSGDGAQTMLGFLASVRRDPEVAKVFRETVISRMHEHLRSLLAAELGDDFADLDLRATAGPAILIYSAAVCGRPIDAEAMAGRLTELLFAPPPPGLEPPPRPGRRSAPAR